MMLGTLGAYDVAIADFHRFSRLTAHLTARAALAARVVAPFSVFRRGLLLDLAAVNLRLAVDMVGVDEDPTGFFGDF